MDAPATPTPDIWITAVMTGPSGANMPQRKVNRAEWRYRYRQRHPSEGGGGGEAGAECTSVALKSIAKLFLRHFQLQGNQSVQPRHPSGAR